MTDHFPDAGKMVPEALRLVAEFEMCIEYDSIPSINDIEKAAAELRRLHAENKALRDQKLQAVADQADQMTADEALLWLAREMIRELPIVHRHQGPRRDELIEALNKMLSNG